MLSRVFNKCSLGDYKALSFLLLGQFDEEPPTSWSYGKRPSVFGALLSLLNHPKFKKEVGPSWHYSHNLPYWLGLEQAPDGFYPRLQRIFHSLRRKNIEKLGWPQLIALVINDPRFEKAYKRTHGTGDLGQLRANIENIAARYTRRLSGKIEFVNSNTVRGWVTDLDNPAASITLQIRINGHYAGECRADLYRRELQEQFGGHGCFGFDHQFHMPHWWHVAQAQTIEILDINSGTPICPPKQLMLDRADFASSMLRLADGLGYISRQIDAGALKEAGEDLREKLSWLTNSLPRIEDFAAIPVQDYALFQSLYHNRRCPDIAQGPRFSVWPLTAIKDGHPVERALADQSYQHWAIADKDADWHIFLEDGDRLEPAALAHMAETAEANAQAKILFSDYDIKGIGEEHHTNPHVFSAFDLDRLLQRYDHSRAVAYHRDLFEGEISAGTEPLALWLGALERFGAAAIAHTAFIGFHLAPAAAVEAELNQLLTQEKAKGRHKELVQAYLSGKADVVAIDDPFAGPPSGAVDIHWHDSDKDARLAVIIPTRDHTDLLDDCITSLREMAAEPERLEFIVVDNGSREEASKKWLADFKARGEGQVIPYDRAFNWSQMNNVAASLTDATRLLFLNNDTKALAKNWDSYVHGYLSRDDVGAIGARLLFEDGTIQHAGVVLYPDGIATHEAIGDSTDDGLYLDRTRLTHRVSAVTGAFLACRRDVFDAVGGFDGENLPVTFNDIDFCLKLHAAGYNILYVPRITFEHLESKSRGHDSLDPQKLKRARAESDWMVARWEKLLSQDPLYPTIFSPAGKAYSLLRPFR